VPPGERCPECSELLSDGGTCLNVECRRAQEQATRSATRETAKATTAAAAGSAPQAWTRSGRVD